MCDVNHISEKSFKQWDQTRDYIEKYFDNNQELLQIGIHSDKIKFIYHGVPYRFLQTLAYRPTVKEEIRQQIGFKKGDFLIICPTRLDERKGLDALLKAAIMLKNEISHLNFKIVIKIKIRSFFG